MLDEGVVDELLSLWNFMVANADGRCEVTVEMLRRKSRSKKECVAAGLHGFQEIARPGKQRPGLSISLSLQFTRIKVSLELGENQVFRISQMVQKLGVDQIFCKRWSMKRTPG